MCDNDPAAISTAGWRAPSELVYELIGGVYQDEETGYLHCYSPMGQAPIFEQLMARHNAQRPTPYFDGGLGLLGPVSRGPIEYTWTGAPS